MTACVISGLSFDSLKSIGHDYDIVVDDDLFGVGFRVALMNTTIKAKLDY